MKTTLTFICVLFICRVIAAPLHPVYGQGTGQRPLSIAQLEQDAQKASGPERLELLLELVDRLWRDEPDRSFTYARAARTLARQLNLPRQLFRALNRIGGWYYINEQYKEAVEFYLEALKLEPRIDEKRLVANLLVNIGMVYWKLGDFRRAEQYQRRSLDLRRTSPHSAREMGFTLNNLGLALFEQGKVADALEFHRQALELFRQTGNKRQIAAALNNIAYDLEKTGDYVEAITHLLRGRRLYRQAGYRWGEVNADLGIAIQYKHLGDYASAIPLLQTALSGARAIGARDLLVRVYRELSMSYKYRGSYNQALELFNEYAKIKKELNEERIKKHKAVMEIVYQTAKKDTELNLLKKKAEGENLYRRILLVAGVLSLGLIVAILLRFNTRKKLNLRLSLSEKRFRTLFSYAGDAILLSRSGVFADCNQKALDMFGFSREEMMTGTMADLSPVSQPDGRLSALAMESYVEEAMNGRLQRFYWKLKKKDGSLFDAMISLSMLPLAGGPYLQFIVQDTSERKRLEDEKVKSAKLETAGLLAHNLSRDVSYLIAVMRRNIDAVKLELTGNDRLSSLINPVESAVRSLEILSGKFITIAEGGFLPRKKTQLSALIRGVVLKKSGSSVRLELDIAPDLWPVICDEHQILHMLTAVVSNAADAIANLEDRGFIKVTAANLDREGESWISIQVTDNGEGIPPDILPKVFDPYFSTRSDVTRKGLGMGLALAHAIAGRHGGGIDITSGNGKGTVCRILLPANGENRS